MPPAARMLLCALTLAMTAGCGSPAATQYYANEELRQEELSPYYQLTYNRDANAIYFDETYFDLKFTVFSDAYYSFGVAIVNQSQHPLTVDWNRLEYVDVGGTPHSVIHQGVGYGSPVSAQKPTVVPPMTTVRDQIRPADRKMDDGAWRLMRPAQTPPVQTWSDSVTLVMPVRSEGRWHNYRFELPVGEIDTNGEPFEPYW